MPNADARAALKDVENTSRPILVRDPRVLTRRGHKPVVRNGELDTECGAPGVDRMIVRDHFEVRKTLSPCPECFPDGYPFTYGVRQLEPYRSMDRIGADSAYHPLSVPDEFLPDEEQIIG